MPACDTKVTSGLDLIGPQYTILLVIHTFGSYIRLKDTYIRLKRNIHSDETAKTEFPCYSECDPNGRNFTVLLRHC